LGSPTPVCLVGISYFRTEEKSNSMSRTSNSHHGAAVWQGFL
jgi:hypothetical protein